MNFSWSRRSYGVSRKLHHGIMNDEAYFEVMEVLITDREDVVKDALAGRLSTVGLGGQITTHYPIGRDPQKQADQSYSAFMDEWLKDWHDGKIR